MNRILLIGFINSLLFTQSNEFMKGVDLSMLKQVEYNGGLFMIMGIKLTQFKNLIAKALIQSGLKFGIIHY